MKVTNLQMRTQNIHRRLTESISRQNCYDADGNGHQKRETKSPFS